MCIHQKNWNLLKILLNTMNRTLNLIELKNTKDIMTCASFHPSTHWVESEPGNRTLFNKKKPIFPANPMLGREDWGIWFSLSIKHNVLALFGAQKRRFAFKLFEWTEELNVCQDKLIPFFEWMWLRKVMHTSPIKSVENLPVKKWEQKNLI